MRDSLRNTVRDTDPEQRTLYEGHGTVLQASLDDPGDTDAYWVEVRYPGGMVGYRKESAHEAVG